MFARANSVSPGYIITDITTFVPQDVKELWKDQVPMGRQGEAHELQGAFFYFASDLSTYTSGETLVLEAVLEMCDIQLLTGFGILLSGYINLFIDTISAYHWYIIVYLVWFSNLTHVACMTVLRGHLHRHPTQRRWRLSLMFILWVGLLVAIGPTFWFDWMGTEEHLAWDVSTTNARCFYYPSIALNTMEWRACQASVELHKEKGNITYTVDECVASDTWGPTDIPMESHLSFQTTMLSVILAIFTFLTRLVKMNRSWSFRTRMSILDKPINWYLVRTARQMSAQSKRPARSIITRMRNIGILLRISWGLMLYTYLDILSSELVDTYWLFTLAIWGTVRLLRVRASVDIDENKWGFGQILPVFLLIGPVVAFAVPFLGAMKKTTEEGSTVSVEDISEESQNQVERRLTTDLSETTSAGLHDTGPTMSEVSDPDNKRSKRNIQPLNQVSRIRVEPTDFGKIQSSGILSARHMSTADINTQMRDLLVAHCNGSLETVTIDAKNLRSLLREYYTESKCMEQVIVLACAQVIPVTVAFFLAFHGVKIGIIGIFAADPDLDSENILLFLANVVIIQPLNCLCAIFLGFALRKGRGIKREVLRVPIYLWALFGIDVVSVTVFSMPFDVAFWLFGMLIISMILLIWR
ncbi:hypothetical protein CGLO_00076 [Colletotrichum gloeosporioides Cg-14]|uniref:Integral membrane protein n=1 Tax=Colletotrichum gloeosporioides (strain Cg-14) TaxID=1237896 RepID=T0L492_COLGC|nr:hypothetical protein CGLO_00076 [Colletotrichum gloeosporioides Cg-14]